MKDLPQIKLELKELLTESIPSVIERLQELLPEGSSKLSDVLLLEGRFNEENRKLLRGTIDNEELKLAYNRIRASLMDLIDALTDADLSQGESVSDNKKAPQKGELLYRIPREMQLNERAKCIVRIAMSEEEIIKNLELDTNVELRSLDRISNLMQVTIIDPNHDKPFAIASISESEQMVLEDGYTEWVFYVTPLKEGTYPLIIKVAVIELVFNKERKREIVLEEEVAVTTKAPDPAAYGEEMKLGAAFMMGGGATAGATEASGSEPPVRESAPTASSVPPPQASPASSGRMGWVRAAAGVVGVLLIAVVGFQLFSGGGSTGPGDTDQWVAMDARAPNQYASSSRTFTASAPDIQIIEKPEVFSTVTERVQLSAASTKYQVIPAQASTETEQIEVATSYEGYQCIDPVFTDTKEEVQVGERFGDPERRDIQYEMQKKQVMVRPAYTTYECIPPSFDIKKEKYIAVAAYNRKESFPPKFETVEEVVSKGYSYVEYAKPEYETAESIEISPATTEWVLRKKEGCDSENINDCMEWVEETIPAVTQEVPGVVLTGCPEGFEFKDGICERTVEVPDKVVTKQVVSDPGGVKDVRVEPQYKEIEKKVYKGKGKFREKKVPAEYRTIEFKVIKNIKGASRDSIIPIFETIAVKKIKSKARTKPMKVPAQYRTITMRVMRDEQVREVNVPPQYRTETHKVITKPKEQEIQPFDPPKTETVDTRVLVKKGGNTIQVKVLKDPSESVVRQVQERLKGSGHYSGPINGIWNAESITALNKYQNQNMLPIGGLDKETLGKLGVNY